MARRTVTATLTGTPSITFREAIQFLENLRHRVDPDKALSISSVRYNHPTDTGEDRISVTYEEEA